MTTISASTAYALQALYGQNVTQTATTKAGTAQTGTQSSTTSSTANTTTGSTTSASLADILAAARNSASLPFATVGQNARTVLDAGLAAYTQATGAQTPGDQTSADQWSDIFGGMDRRSLFAVSSNQGGQFSTLEQTAAKALMSAQVTNAGTVNSSDPVSTQLAGYAKRIDLLSNVSPEEKQTATWAYAFAAAKTNANMIDFDSRMPQTDSSSSPLVSVLMGAMNNAQTQAGTTIDFGNVDNIGQITSQSWATNYASQIESAFAARYNPGTSINLSA